MVPAGAPTQQVVDDLADLLAPGDLVIDGGNSRFSESMARGAALAERGIGFIDCGTSGGVWGLENGYCLMVGGAPPTSPGPSPPSTRWRRRAASPTWARAVPGTTRRWSTTASSTG